MSETPPVDPVEQPAEPAEAETPPAPAVAPTRWNVLEAMLAFFIPGLGHVVIGEKRRGLIVGGFILSLFVLGLLIGGVAVVDRQASYAPFVRFGQVFMGPTFAVEWFKDHQLTLAVAGEPDEDQAQSSRWTYSPSYGRMEEQGVLFTAIAGLLNLMAIIDVLYRPGKRLEEGPEDETAGPASEAGS